MSDVVIDTSAAFAVLTGEPTGGPIAHAIESSQRRMMSAATLVELGIVLEARLGPVGSAVVERFLRASQAEIIGVDSDQARLAIDGWRRFGKGRHPAGLNYGDAFVYALASSTGASLICTGGDFRLTGLQILDLT